jgi:hypothetical protein
MFHRNRKIYPKIQMEMTKTPNNQSNTEKKKKKSNAGVITIPDFKLYYRALVTKTAWYLHKNRHVAQWNKTAEISPHSYSHPTSNKGTKNTLEKTTSSTNGFRKNWISILED